MKHKFKGFVGKFKGFVGRSYVEHIEKALRWSKGGKKLKQLIVNSPAAFDGLFKYRGIKADWDDEDWPPVPVEITIKIGE
jgi:hypothetical protein